MFLLMVQLQKCFEGITHSLKALFYENSKQLEKKESELRLLHKALLHRNKSPEMYLVKVCISPDTTIVQGFWGIYLSYLKIWQHHSHSCSFADINDTTLR